MDQPLCDTQPSDPDLESVLLDLSELNWKTTLIKNSMVSIVIYIYTPCAIMLHFSNMVFQWYWSIGQELEQVSLPEFVF